VDTETGANSVTTFRWVVGFADGYLTW
jgi:hypothetical protein